MGYDNTLDEAASTLDDEASRDLQVACSGMDGAAHAALCDRIKFAARIVLIRRALLVAAPFVLSALGVLVLTDVPRMLLGAVLWVLLFSLIIVELVRVETTRALTYDVLAALKAYPALSSLQSSSFLSGSFLAGEPMALLVDVADRASRVLRADQLSSVSSELLWRADCGVIGSGRDFRCSMAFSELSARLTNRTRQLNGFNGREPRTAPPAVTRPQWSPRRCETLAAMCEIECSAAAVDDELAAHDHRWTLFAAAFAEVASQHPARDVAQMFDGMFDSFDGSPVELCEVIGAVLTPAA